MDDFEKTCIELMVRGGLLEADIQQQLPYVRVMERSHDRDGRQTVLYTEPGAPAIIPRDAGIAADLIVAGVGEVTVHLDVADGFMRLFAAEHPPTGWPDEPQVLGFAEYPER